MNGSVVVDASLAVKWVLIEPFRTEARRLLDDWEQHGVRRIVPCLFLSEINTPLLKLRREGQITLAAARLGREGILAAVTVVPDTAVITLRALEIADVLALRTAHDSLYIALAEREDCDLWTADERFYNVAHARFRLVRWIGALPPPSQTASP